jgi:ligand-binding SRPBCC domain-containing protein
MKFEFRTSIKKSFQEIKSNFDQELFVHLSKGILPFEIERFDGCEKDNEIHIKIGIWPLKISWVSWISFEETNASGWSFIDEGKVLPWPLIYWHHHHRVDRIGPTESLIVDSIQYKCSSKFLGTLIKPLLWVIFAMRPKRYRQYFKE